LAEEEIGVEVRLSSASERIVPPKSLLTSVFTITNSGIGEDTYDLKSIVPEGWHIISSLRPISLLPKQTKTLPLTVSVPITALADVPYEIGLSTASQLNPQISDSARVSVKILPHARIKLIGPAKDAKGRPGQGLSYSFSILNLGNGKDRFEITALSAHKEKVGLSMETVELGVGEQTEVIATIHIPLDVSTGTKHVLTLKVESLLLEQGVFDKNVVYTSILEKKGAKEQGVYKTLPSQLTVYYSGLGTEEPRGMNVDFTTGGQLDDKHWMDFRYRGPYHKDKKNYRGFSEEEIALEFGGENWDIGLGDIAASLSDLTISSLSEEGARVRFDKGPMNFTFFNMEKEDTSFREDFLGGRITGKIDRATEVGLNYFQSNEDKLDPSASRSAEQKEMASISAVRKLENFLIQGEYAGGSFNNGSGEKEDIAWWVNSILKRERIYLNAEYIYAGSDYPGRRKDTDGYRTYASYRFFKPLWVWIHKNQTTNNLEGDPARATDDTDRIELGASFSKENFPFFSLSYEINKSQSTQQVLLSDSKEEAIAFRANESFGTLSLSFDSKYSETKDDIKLVNTKVLEYTGRAYKRWQKISGWAAYSYNLEEDIVGDEEAVLRKELGLIYHPSHKLYSSVSFSQEGTKGEEASDILSFDVTYDPSTDFSLSVEGEMRNNRTDVTKEWEFWLSARKKFDMLLPFIKIRGSVDGDVFIDENNNGTADEGEKGIAGIMFILDENRAPTNKKGRFRLASIVPGEYELDIDISSIPVGLAPKISLPYALKVPRGKLSGITIPLVRVCKVRGRVFEDKNKNVTMDEEEKGLSLVRVLLIKDGEISRDTFSDIDGKYGFAGILPGKYHISIDEDWLPYRHRLTTVATYTVELKPNQEILEMDFGSIEKEKKIIKTYTAPKVETVYVEKKKVYPEWLTFLIFLLLMFTFTFILIHIARRK